MTTPARYYRLSHEGKDYLVKATSKTQARAHLVRKATCAVANAFDVADLMSKGVKPETAGEQPPELDDEKNDNT